MQEHGRRLADAIEVALPAWVERSVARRLPEADVEVRSAASAAGARAAAEVGAEVRALLDRDVDRQRTTPLTLLRAAVRYPTEVLREASAPPVVRDREQERLFPDDVYDLTPATFADVDPALGDLGLAWGAAKAITHLRRHGAPTGTER